MDDIVTTIVSNGIWAVLFCGLLVYQLRDGKRREEEYTRVIGALSDRLGVVADIKADTEELKIDAKALLSGVAAIGASLDKPRGKKKAEGEKCASPT